MILTGPFTASIRPDEVFRYLGYRKGKTHISPQAEELVSRGLDLARGLFRPAAAVMDLDIIRVAEPAVEVASGVAAAAEPGGAALYRSSWRSPKLAKLLAGCSRVTALLVTAGPAFETETGRLFEQGDPALATVVDAAGSEAAEALAGEIDDQIKKRAASEGFATTWRFSPGYGGWGLEVQPELVELLEGGRIGVSVTGTLMLSPQKSITAVTGWYPCPEPLTQRDHLSGKCQRCEMTGCAYRRLT